MTLWRRVKHFGRQSNLHGLRFIAERDRNWACRIFWLASLCACGWGFLVILQGTLRSADDSITFTVDTNRLLWNTDFPTVSICEKYFYHDTLRELNKLYPTLLDKYDYNYKKMFADLSFAENPCTLCTTGCGAEMNCSMDWGDIADHVRQPCSGLIHDCSWQGKPFDCCSYFLPVDTEFGLCYSFNTLQSRLSKTVPLFKSNRTTGPGSLTFFIYKDLEVFIHGAEEIPWLKTDLDMRFDASDDVDFIFDMTEISNDDQVAEMDLDTRKCRFPHETMPSRFNESYQIYGYSTCRSICDMEMIYEQCNCVHHLRDKIYRHLQCNYTGLGCIATFIEERKKIPQDRLQKICEHCVSSCEEIELTKIFFLETENESDDDSRVTIKMRSLPNIQYRRNVVRTKMDLVVSIGGLAGLFFGASLQSLVEAFYLISVRPKNEKSLK